MTRRIVIFANENGRVYATPEFNGDKQEIRMKKHKRCYRDRKYTDPKRLLKMKEKRSYISRFCLKDINLYDIFKLKLVI